MGSDELSQREGFREKRELKMRGWLRKGGKK